MADSENEDSQSNSMSNLPSVVDNTGSISSINEDAALHIAASTSNLNDLLLDSSTLLHEKRTYHSEPAGIFTIEATDEGNETNFCLSMIQPIVVSKNDTYDIELPEGNIKIKYPGIIEGVELYFTDQSDEITIIHQNSRVVRESCCSFYNKLFQIDPVNAALDFLQYQQYQAQIVTGYNFLIGVNNQEIIYNPVISEVYYLVSAIDCDKITNIQIEVNFIGDNMEHSLTVV